MEQGVFDMSFYALFVRQSMKQLCAPVRDDEVNALQGIHEVVPLFRSVAVGVYKSVFRTQCLELSV